jgi:predicted DNA-binding transcriptional regulator YafY
MPRIPDDYKQDRLDRVANYVLNHPDGLAEQEIGQALNIHRRTLNNYLRELESMGRIWRDETLWYPLPYEQTKIRRFDLNAEQATTLYLATRLLVKMNDRRNEIAETLLLRLAHILASDAGVDRVIEESALELAQRQTDDDYSQIFKAVARGYVYRRWVEIVYRPRKKQPFQTRFAPYLLEPSAIGYTTYIIGHSAIVDDIRTYKLERIQQAQLTHEEFTVPDDFPGLEMLRSAWSIIHGESLEQVCLRFHPSVVDRVLETQWHASQETQADPDHPGYLLWSARIADLTDFLPWVRGWGVDVEVLAPDELRGILQGESRRLAELYGWQTHWGEPENEDSTSLSQTFQDFFG